MKSKILLGLSLIAIVLVEARASEDLIAANTRRKVSRGSSTSSKAAPDDLKFALSLAQKGNYIEASQKLFQLSYSPRFADKRMQIKYILGLTLFQMKLYQTAAFQFIGVVKNGQGPYMRQSMEKLSIAADALGDDTLLNYAISRVNVDEFPKTHRDMLYYRIGEFQARNNQFTQAADSFAKVGRGSSLYTQAKYSQGLALAQANQLDRAIQAYDELIEARSGKVTDKARVAGLMGRARVLYQKKDWDAAIEAYRNVPRDTELWHDTLFESSWAMLRSGRFRSALSNFHSLHSDYYENNYIPESLLLRAIVYLYICKYDEIDKVLGLFSRVYKPVYKQVDEILKSEKDPVRYYSLVNDVIKNLRASEDGDASEKPKKMVASDLPYLVAQKISREGDFQRSFRYIQKLLEERKHMDGMPATWRGSTVGQYARKVIETRLKKARARAGNIVRSHLETIREDLVDLLEQEGFIRYEMLSGRKETLKKRIAGKEVEKKTEDDRQRDYYIQNGYEYWPFQGEYWLDELGNYHYVGTQSCN